MALSEIINLSLVNDNTEIIIRNQDSRVVAQGNWYQDAIQDYLRAYVESFTWQDDNKLYININRIGGRKGRGYGRKIF